MHTRIKIVPQSERARRRERERERATVSDREREISKPKLREMNQKFNLVSHLQYIPLSLSHRLRMNQAYSRKKGRESFLFWYAVGSRVSPGVTMWHGTGGVRVWLSNSEVDGARSVVLVMVSLRFAWILTCKMSGVAVTLFTVLHLSSLCLGITCFSLELSEFPI